MSRLIFGPAYLDRVIRVDRPLIDPALGERPLDASVDGRYIQDGDWLLLIDPIGNKLEILLPLDWTGPTGSIELARRLAKPPGGWSRAVRAVSSHDDLGGMGAGYASALGGELICALGPESDPNSQKIATLLHKAGVRPHPIRVEGASADWTLLITSGEFGDKLPIGFRGCHSALVDFDGWANTPADLRVVAALPNRLARQALAGPAKVRFFAPALRNMLDRDPPISAFTQSIDILCCNRGEWNQLIDREQVAWQLSILVVTDGPRGATLRCTAPDGEATTLQIPAFPRTHPPQDTNRAGEAFAANLVTTLLEAGWTPGTTSLDLAQKALERASAAAALVLDRLDFGFPTAREVDLALWEGRV